MMKFIKKLLYIFIMDDMVRAYEEGIYEGILRERCRYKEDNSFIFSNLDYYMKEWE